MARRAISDRSQPHPVSLVDADGVDFGSANPIPVSLAAGDLDLGNVDVESLPPLVAGTAAIGKVGHDTTGLGDGRKVVTTAGTAVALAASTACKSVVITAELDNTNTIVVGSSSVVAALATRRGTPLNAGATLVLAIDNLADVFIDSLVDGEGVTFLYGT